MKKRIKVLGIVSFVLALTLAFGSQNNFKFQFANWGNGEKVISSEEIEKTINEKLITVLGAAIHKSNPDLYMTKCYVDLKYSIVGDFGLKGLKSRTFYETSIVYGEISLDNCGQIEQVCKFSLRLNDQEIQIKESYLSPWVKLPEFIKNIESSNPQ